MCRKQFDFTAYVEKVQMYKLTTITIKWLNQIQWKGIAFGQSSVSASFLLHLNWLKKQLLQSASEFYKHYNFPIS